MGKERRRSIDSSDSESPKKVDNKDSASRGEPSAHAQVPVNAPPPPYDSAPPPSGFRVPLIPTVPFPPADQRGPPPCYDLDGSPVYIGSALFDTSVHPCKLTPHFKDVCRVPYGGREHVHNGRYDLLPFVPEMMEWVHTSRGRLPPGRRLVEGGYENGAKLYHGIAVVSGARVPGKCAEHLGGCNVAFGGAEQAVTDDYEILCWK